jgi:phage-related minor tail protein
VNPSAADHRRLGAVVLAYGALGLLLFGGLFVGLFLAGSVLSDAPERAGAAIARVVSVLDSTGRTLAAFEESLGGAETTLTTSAQTVDGAAAALTGAGSSLTDISTALTAFSILGASPLAGVGASVGALAGQVSSIGQQIGSLSDALSTNAADLVEVRRALGGLRADLADLQSALVSLDLAGFGRLVGLVRWAMLAVVAWLAVGSAILVWFGIRLRRPGSATG